MFQQFTAVGNLGNDPEMRYTQAGVAVTTFNLAVNKNWVDANGQRHDKTLWVRVSAWRKLAETVAKHLHKGSKVLVVGELERANAYLGKDGAPAASIEVTASLVRFLDSRQATTEATADDNDGPGPEMRDEDIPF